MKQFITPPVIVRALIGVILALSIVASGVGVAVVNGLRDRATADETSAFAGAAPTNQGGASDDAAPGASDGAVPEAAPTPQEPPAPPTAGQSMPTPVLPPPGAPSVPDARVEVSRAHDDEETPTQPLTVPVMPADAAGRIAVGISTNGVPTAARIDEYRRVTGAPPAIVGWFVGWGDPFGWRDQLEVVSDTGALPMVAIDPMRGSDTVPLRDVASGAFDDYIRSLAVQARTYGAPLLFRFGHEMNLPSIEWQMKGNTPQDFVNAWRHMVEIFRTEHADNVRWVWSPNADCMGECPFADYYPGDAYVDWVAIDVYNFADAHGTPWRSLSDLLTSSYESLSRLTDKPMMLSEIATVEQGGDKAAWIRTALSDLPKRFPAVQAIVWWDRNDGEGQDYRFESSPSAKEAFLHQLLSGSYGSTLSPDGR